uniref:Capsid polyprotein VP90 n=1 Tax=Human astrovirus-1 TaxID=12456 RepID=Q14V10_HASV1|nr:outer capsid protein [Human astrovirus 1]
MASKPSKQVTVEVNNGRSRSRSRPRSQSRGRDKSVKITVNSRNKGGGQNGRNKHQSNQRVRNIVSKQLKKQVSTGPKPAICQGATATLGTVGSHPSGTTEIEACILLNPVLVKDATGSTQFGPVQALGAQYSMWKLKYLNVKLTSMVGSSAVNGTVVRVSLNPTSTPSSTSWSGLGARKHLDVTVGKNAVFKLKPADLGGPRDGWWLTNTNDNASDTLGPSIEIHTLGRTMSSYQNQQFTGGLFLVELALSGGFTGYAANPNLVNLMKSTDKQVNVTFNGSAGEPLVMSVPATSHFVRAVVARSTLPTSLARAGERTTSDTVWQVLNTAVSAAELVTPPPFNWLVKGGWWFVKLIAGRTRNGTRQFYVYPSYQDALSYKPALCTGGLPSGLRATSAVTTTLQFTQMNQPSLGHGENTATLGRSIATAGDRLKVILTVGQPVTPNENNKQNWVGKTNTPAEEVIKIGVNTQSYNVMNGLTMQGFMHIKTVECMISSIDWYDEEMQPLEVPAPMSELLVMKGINKKADVYAAQQYKNSISNNKHQITSVYLIRVKENFQVTNHLSYFFREKVDTTATELMKIRPQTYHTTVNFVQNNWYLLTSTVLHTGSLPSGWVWMNQELMNNENYIVDQGMKHLMTTPPVSSQLYFEMLTSLPQAKAEYLDQGDQAVVTYDSPGQALFSAEETDSDFESTEDETDEVDRFDLHLSSESDDDDADENNRVTLLSTLINQGMSVERATKITSNAFPTRADRLRRSVYNDLLVSGLGPDAAWSHACEQARKVGDNLTYKLSGSRGHAE